MAPPVVTKHPSSTITQVLSIASFECTARSYGEVSLSWKKLNSTLPLTVDITMSMSLNEITSVIRLESVGYYKGYYYCVVENSAGTVNSTFAYFDIRGSYMALRFVVNHNYAYYTFCCCFTVPCPEMIVNPEPIKVRQGSAVMFSCVAWSYGGLVYEWNKNDSLMLPQNSAIYYENKPLINAINTTVYELTLFNVQETNEGHYCCIASNGCGSTSACALLEVDSKLQYCVLNMLC